MHHSVVSLVNKFYRRAFAFAAAIAICAGCKGGGASKADSQSGRDSGKESPNPEGGHQSSQSADGIAVQPSPTEAADREKKDYGDFSVFANGGLRFRSDFIEAYGNGCKHAPLTGEQGAKPSMQAFLEIISVFDRFANKTKFGKPLEFRRFFSPPADQPIAKYQDKIDGLINDIERIYQSEPGPSDYVRFQGKIQELVDADPVAYGTIQDRFREITGRRDAVVTQAVVDFYDGVANLVHLRLALAYVKNVMILIDSAASGAHSTTFQDHTFSVLAHAFSEVANRRGYTDCKAIVGNSDKLDVEKRDEASKICQETFDFVTTVTESRDMILAGKGAEAYNRLSSTVTLLNSLIVRVNDFLRSLGVDVPSTT